MVTETSTWRRTIPQPLPTVVREGHIQLLEAVNLPEGARLLVMFQHEADFWLGASQASLDEVWVHPEDDVYAELLEE